MTFAQQLIRLWESLVNPSFSDFERAFNDLAKSKKVVYLKNENDLWVEQGTYALFFNDNSFLYVSKNNFTLGERHV